VRIVRSTRRRKTASARLVDGTIEVRVPAGMLPADEERCVADLIRRTMRRQRSDSVDLDRRAGRLATRFELPRPRSVRWVDNQQRRWGSCTPHTGEIRISRQLADMPAWVLDYVLVHELAHLAVAAHDERFWALVNRYPRTERARGFLIAKGLEADDAAPTAPAQSGSPSAHEAAGAE